MHFATISFLLLARDCSPTHFRESFEIEKSRIIVNQAERGEGDIRVESINITVFRVMTRSLASFDIRYSIGIGFF